MIDENRARTTLGSVVNGVGAYHLSSGERRWRVVYTKDRKVKGRAGFRTKAAALHWQASNTSAIDTGTYRDRTKQHTEFGPYAEQWFSDKRLDLRPNTITWYESLLKNDILPTYDTMQFREIDAER